MDLHHRLAAGGAVALMLLSLAACGGNKGTSASTASTTSGTTASRTTASKTTAAAGAASATSATKATSGSSSGSGTGTKTCPGGDVSGVIGGKSKCLHVGQECSEKHAADYTQYGFACTQQGQRYVLTKK